MNLTLVIILGYIVPSIGIALIIKFLFFYEKSWQQRLATDKPSKRQIRKMEKLSRDWRTCLFGEILGLTHVNQLKQGKFYPYSDDILEMSARFDELMKRLREFEDYKSHDFLGVETLAVAKIMKMCRELYQEALMLSAKIRRNEYILEDVVTAETV
jgi:hypothetical protein